jgi:hypothetical protein
MLEARLKFLDYRNSSGVSVVEPDRAGQKMDQGALDS